MLSHSALCPAITPLATGLSLNHSLCSCQGAVSILLAHPAVSFRRSVRLTNPENDTEPSTLRINSFRDAVRLFVNPPFQVFDPHDFHACAVSDSFDDFVVANDFVSTLG